MFDPDEVPDGDVTAPHHFWIGIGLSVFGFWSVWQYYPTVGAAMTLVGLLVALDDAIEHAFDVRTPLDELWTRVLYPVVQWIENR